MLRLTVVIVVMALCVTFIMITGKYMVKEAKRINLDKKRYALQQQRLDLGRAADRLPHNSTKVWLLEQIALIQSAESEGEQGA